MTAVIDTHSHLYAHEFDHDREAVLARAREAGVEAIITLGEDLPTSERCLELAETHEHVFAAAGYHPHNAKDADEAGLAYLKRLAKHPRVVAVGEIGLDFYRNHSPRHVQVDVFRRQLETAASVAKPVAVHCREAHDAMLAIAESWSEALGGRLPDGRPLGVMHYFDGDPALAERYVRLGFLISVHTSVTHPNKRTLHEVASHLPLEVLVVETDAPYGAPQAHRGKRNEPAYATEAIARIAELCGITFDEAAERTSENARRLFGLPVPAAGGVA